ncbi:MAG: hypothetical protein ACJ8GN_01985 [Longimicrobiaceae bacterium]
MRPKRTTTDTQTYPAFETRPRPAEICTHAGEHPAFDPGFIDQHRTIWFTVPSSRPPCLCGLPARRDRLTCGAPACMGVL